MIARAARHDDCAGVIALAQQHPRFAPTSENAQALFDLAMQCGGMFVAEEDAAIIGFLCAVRAEHPFTSREFINVVAWWVPKRHRATGAGLGLVRCFARWCSTQPAELITISAPLSSDLGSVLRTQGFAPVETLWVKGVGTWAE